MRTPPPVPSPSAKAFSLLELLAAVGILAVLVALIFPLLGQMQKQSMNTKCLANLRATGAAFLQYCTEHDGHFLPTKYWYSRLSTAESPGLRDYLGFSQNIKSTSSLYRVDSVLTCPLLKREAPRKFPCMLNRCYSMNVFLIAKDVNLPDAPEAGDNPGSPKRLSNVASPGRMWAFTDGSTSDVASTGEFGTVVSESGVGKGQLLYPHKERQNVVFLDGHVEALAPGQFQSPQSPRDFWGDTRKP